MKYERIELRLDEEHKRKIAELRERYGTTASDILRRGIDAMYEEAMAQRRKEALERILASEGVEDVPDIETLKRQSGRSNDIIPDDPY